MVTYRVAHSNYWLDLPPQLHCKYYFLKSAFFKLLYGFNLNFLIIVLQISIEKLIEK